MAAALAMVSPTATQAGRSGSNRYLYVQCLRFFAALLVVYAHGIDVASGLTGSASLFGAGNLENFGAIGVDVFFVISGFIIARTGFIDRRLEPADFAWKRLRRIVPIYWLLTLPWIFIRLGEGSLDANVTIATLLFWPASGHAVSEPILVVGWSLCFEMLFYAAAALLLFTRHPRAIWVAIAAFALAWKLRILTGLPTFQFLGNPMILEFLMGVAIAQVTKRPALQSARWLIPLLLVAAVGILLVGLIRGLGGISEFQYVLNGQQSLPRVIKWGMPSACLVLAAVLAESGRTGRPANAWLAAGAFLGDASYSIYLMHPLTMWLLRYHGQWLPLRVSPELTVVFSIAVACSAGALCYVLLERPLLRALPERLTRRDAATAGT